MKLKGLQFQRGVAANPSASQSIQAFHTTWDWSGFIKPQIDLAVTQGANALKMLTGVVAAYDGTITQATLIQHVQQVLAYCQQQGLAVYLTLWDGFTDPQAQATPAAVTIGQAVAAAVDKFDNVVGLDLGNECVSPWCYGSTNGMLHIATLQPAIKAVTSLPLSVGLSCAAATELTSTLTKNVSGYCDFMDFHTYYDTGDPAPADFASYRAQSWYKPWVIGECGKARSAGTALVQSRWLALRDLANETDCFGSFGYQILEYGGSAGYGMYPALAGSPYSDMTGPFSLWPKA